MANSRKTSAKIASKASSLLKDGRTSAKTKSVLGSTVFAEDTVLDKLHDAVKTITASNKIMFFLMIVCHFQSVGSGFKVFINFSLHRHFGAFYLS